MENKVIAFPGTEQAVEQLQEATGIPAENIEVTVDDSVKGTEATQRATQLFGAFEHMNAVKKMRADMNEERLRIAGDDDVAAKLSSMVANLTPEQVAQLDDAAVAEIYKTEDGEIELAIDLPANKEMEFKRDFLVYLRETEVASEAVDAELAALEEEIKDGEEELKNLIAEFGDLSTYMRNKLQTEYDAAEGAHQERLGKMIASYDDAYTLDRVFDHYSKFGVENTVGDYYRRADNVFERYIRVIKKLNFRTDLTNFNNLEARLLEEKYNKYPNMFLFSVIKMYAYKKDATPDQDGVFLSQLAVNLKSLYADSFATEEKKQTFINGITRVLDLFVGDENEKAE